MCTILLPPGCNPIAVNKYIDIYLYQMYRSNQSVSLATLTEGAVGVYRRLTDTRHVRQTHCPLLAK
jgi:hypothetical protein